MPVPDGNPPRLLAVFAHPDDEQWGTAGALALCVERGIEVYILSATSGDKGEISDPALASPETLGAVREEELRAACALLGLQPPILLRHGDGALVDVDHEHLVGQIVAEIRRLRPHVVLTFDANGGYGHLDHMVIHQATLAACERAAEPGDDPSGFAPHRIDKLYATAYPRSILARMNGDLERLGIPTIDYGPVQTLFGDAILTPDEAVTTVVPVDRFFDLFWAAQLAHRTQFGPLSPFVVVGTEVARPWHSRNFFRRIAPAPAAGADLPDEDDLWAGLPLPGVTR